MVKQNIKKIYIVSMIGLITIATTACSKTNGNNGGKTVQYFELDAYSQSLHNQSSDSQDTQATQDVNTENNEDSSSYSNTLALITLVNNDNSQDYTTEGNDIVYKGTRYVNLYNIINSINTNYDKNTLINFIVKTFNAKSDTIYCDLIVDNISDADSDVEEITLDEQISDVKKYNDAKSQFGENVSWMISLTESSDNSVKQIYGCSKYMLVTSDGIDKEIDMSKYDSTLGTVTNGDSEDVTDDTESDTEEDEAERVKVKGE